MTRSHSINVDEINLFLVFGVIQEDRSLLANKSYIIETIKDLVVFDTHQMRNHNHRFRMTVKTHDAADAFSPSPFRI